ncbi:hypothetical protein ACFYXH_02460 [Streptomyces sp. NPDC002730]|uniref:hypothetical protein n=1 Tax=Streptomyces sp. NPDC002730 TaxID=3364662 RepID=UPI00367984BE
MRRTVTTIATTTVLGLGVLAGTAHADSHHPASAAEPVTTKAGSRTFTAQVAKIDPRTGKQVKARTVLCEWNHKAEWTAGNPTKVTGTASFFCAAVGPDGPQITGEIRARLLDGKNGSTVADGKWSFINAIDPTPTVAEVTAKVKRPKSLYVQNEMHGAFMTPGWVWTSHPKGCSGAATPNIVCNINSSKFSV